MLDRIRSRQREFNRRGHEWLRRYPRVRRALEMTGCLRGGAEAMARGVAVGLFVGLTPTVGFQTVLMILGCMLIGANFPLAFAVSWISNPLTIGPLYWGFHGVGKAFFAIVPVPGEWFTAWFMQGPGDQMMFAVIGSLLVAFPACVAGYFVSHRISATLAARRRGRRIGGVRN